MGLHIKIIINTNFQNYVLFNFVETVYRNKNVNDMNVQFLIHGAILLKLIEEADKCS